MYFISDTFDDFEFEDEEFEEKFNPWDVKNVEEFRLYCCPECSTRNVHKSDFIRHALIFHPKSQIIFDKFEDNKDDVKPIVTEVTETSSQNVVNGEVHPPEKDHQVTKKAVVALVPLSDRVIQKYTRNIASEDSSIKNVHENVRYNCDKCEKSFSRKFDLSDHVRVVHENIRHNCDKCEKSFTRKTNLNEHIQAVHENVRYSCDGCEDSFSQKKNLNEHLRNVHENVRYSCNICEKSFSLKNYLRKHIRNVHENVRHSCDKCEKSFAWKTNLNEHLRIVHENVRYSCDRCEESFSWKKNLIEHIRSPDCA